MSYKRKRASYSPAAQALVLARPPKRASGPAFKKRRFTPGKDRTGGFYGRFSPAGGELKFFDSDINVGAFSATGAVQASINNIAQGTAENQRIGRKCTLRSLHWTYEIGVPNHVGSATPPGGQEGRIIMFIDKQANGAGAAVLDLLQTADWQSYRNLANSGRFQVLMDKTITFNHDNLSQNGAANYSSVGITKSYKCNKKVNIPLEFNGVDGVTSEIRSNNIGILFISKNANDLSLGSKLRLRFSDN